MSARALARAFALAFVGWSRNVRAQESPDGGLTVRGDRARADRERVEATPQFATSIDVRERGQQTASVADLVDEAPGVHARRAGDSLSPTTVSLRGAPGSHVIVAWDGVILNDASGGSVDLSLLAPSLLERVDVYRGLAPARLGSAGLGGAIELVSRAPTRRFRWHANLGLGSFLERRFTASAIGALGPLATVTALGYRGTLGNFPFFDDGGTPLATNDDVPDRPRVNNAADALDLLHRSCFGAPRNALCATLLLTGRVRGVPGPGAAQLTAPGFEQGRILLDAYRRVSRTDFWIEPHLTFSGHGEHFRDPSGLVVPGQITDARSSGTRMQWGWTYASRRGSVQLENTARQHYESYDTRDISQVSPPSIRTGFFGATEATLSVGPSTLSAAVLAELLTDRAADSSPRAHALLSPRVGLRLPIVTELFELRANAGRLERAPTLVDLYGLSGYLLPNPDLVPERGDTLDLGAVFQSHSPSLRVRLETSGYVRRVRDMITLVRRGAVAYKAFNLREVSVQGVEVLARLAFADRVEAVVSYAWTHAVTIAPQSSADGRRPPGVPEHDLYARAQAALGPVRPWAALSVVTGVFFDEANQLGAPTRAMLDMGLSVRIPSLPWLTLDGTVTNVFDQRSADVEFTAGRTYRVRQPVSDFLGYPLPGRSFFVGLRFGSAAPR